MGNQQPADNEGDLSQSTAANGTLPKNPNKPGTAEPSGPKGGPEARPGTDPKNPGDFGHH